jgi:hypothetical protein
VAVGDEDELQIDGNTLGDATESEASESDDDNESESDNSEGEAGEINQKAIRSQKIKKTIIYSDEDDKDEEELTRPVNPVNLSNFQEPSS